MRRIAVLLALLAGLPPSVSGRAAGPAAADVSATPQRLPVQHLPNAFRLHERVLSGGLPDGDAAFQELRDLGVKTVISVDGAQPDVKTAAKYGLRYVHLPHGYDGISTERAADLAKAVRDLPGPVYIHCHHGKHRSPAAAVVACVSLGLLPPDAALRILQTAGTSENYRGLYESALAARPLDDALLSAHDCDYPESAKLPAIAESMIPIEQAHDRLKRFADVGWRTLSDQPDLDPPHEALLLREHFTELQRLPAVQQQADEFRQLAVESEAAAEQLESDLRARRLDKSTKSLADVTQRCTACHRSFRDVPLSEKHTASN